MEPVLPDKYAEVPLFPLKVSMRATYGGQDLPLYGWCAW